MLIVNQAKHVCITSFIYIRQGASIMGYDPT